MKKLNITGKDLVKIGFPQSKAIGFAMEAIEKNLLKKTRRQVLTQLKKVVTSPGEFILDPVWTHVANELQLTLEIKNKRSALLETPDQYAIYGANQIEQGALTQMETAMRLPVTVGGALMPDAHQGYGLPIGGVLAVRNAVIPYGVGVDIGCRMCLTIYDLPESALAGNEIAFKRELVAATKFGAGKGFQGNERADHAVLDKAEFNLIPFIRNLKQKAYEQLGSSGGGNHFVEWGILEMLEDDKELKIPKGKYVALLSHSGSRGLGATIAAYYTKVAKELCQLPKEAVNLAYLSLDTSEGQEYWLAMNLAGDYASACHHVIHDKISKAVGGNVLARIENHHNFAWKEIWNGEEVIVHRKGATPASKDVMGIIPGSMTAPGFLVRGKGETKSINSASHGAGRQMSRTQAIKTIKREQMKDVLKEHGVTLIGAGLDEAPMAYKDINMVMDAQKDLVDVIAKFTPKIVRMADDGSRED
ncbi:MAG: RNA-splicing ligase RtcB [Bacteroidota bacterium]|jgi:tRNA-splicing ligase RtcB|nr:RNA-splicing ligase RtcB [Bacteroidota bacterium]